MVSLTAMKWYAMQALRLQSSMNCKKMHLVFREVNKFCSNQMYTFKKYKNGNLQKTLENGKKVERGVTTLVLSTISMVHFRCLNFKRYFLLLQRKREKPFNFMKLNGTICSYGLFLFLKRSQLICMNKLFLSLSQGPELGFHCIYDVQCIYQ
jgi:hypothetical protein